jgi:hypothetical protein
MIKPKFKTIFTHNSKRKIYTIYTKQGILDFLEKVKLDTASMITLYESHGTDPESPSLEKCTKEESYFVGYSDALTLCAAHLERSGKKRKHIRTKPPVESVS